MHVQYEYTYKTQGIYMSSTVFGRRKKWYAFLFAANHNLRLKPLFNAFKSYPCQIQAFSKL